MSNPFMESAQRMAEDRKDADLQAITGGARMSLDSDREQDIKTQRLADAMGTQDTEFVGRNYDYLDRYARNRKLYDQLDARSVSRELLVKGEYQDDIETLAEVEKSTSYLGIIGKKADKGLATADGGRELSQMMWGDPSQYDSTKFRDAVSGRPDDGLNWVQKIPTDTAEMVGLYMGILPDSGMAAAYGGAGGGMAGNVPGALMGAAGGMKLGTAKEIFEIEAGWAFDEYRALTDVNGDQVDINSARGAALVVGALNAGLEFTGLSMIPGVKGLVRMLRAGGKGTVREILKRPELAKRLGEIAHAYTMGAVGEGVTEGVQELTVEAGKYAVQGRMPTEDEMVGALDASFESAQVGFRAALGLGAPATVVNTAGAVSDSRKSGQMQDVFKSLGDSAKASKLRNDAPEQFKEFIRQVQERHGLVDTLYMDNEAAVTLFQEATDLREAMPETFKSLQEAMETGSYVAIPLDEFVANVAPSDKLADVMKDIAFDPLDPTPRQMEKTKAESEAILKEYQDGMAEIDKADDPLYGQVYVELLAAGRDADVAESEAVLFTAGIKRMAERQGMDPLQYYREQNISIRGEMIEQDGIDVPTYTGGLLNLIRDDKGPKDSQVYGPSLIEYLISIGGINEPEGGELAARDVDKQMREYGRKRLAREQGLSMEEAFERARDSGYVSVEGFAGEENALLEAIDRELKGERVYSDANLSPQMQELQAQLSDLREMMDRAGANIEEMTNEEIMGLLGVSELEQAAQTNTPEFKAWFGDSKVVDDQGRPLVVYHGTTGDFDSFDSTRRGENTQAESAGQGFFFTDDTVTAESYGNYAATDARIARLLAEAERAEKRGDWDEYDRLIIETEDLDASFSDPQARMSGQNAMPVYLSIQDPLVIDAGGENAIGFDIPAAIKQAMKQGRDGVIIQNLDDAAGLVDRDATHFIVFAPTQIKSAIGNRGTFDPANPSILFQGGDDTAMADALRTALVDYVAAFEDTSDIALHNAKVEAYELLRDGGLIDSQVLLDLKNPDSALDYHLERVGEYRTWDEILKDHRELSDEDTELEAVDYPSDIWEVAKLAKGVTDDVREAGYVLPDGTLLDFSGKRDGGPTGERAEDHRQLGFELGGQGYSDDMIAFQKLGAVRIDANAGSADMETMPTYEQIKLIQEIIEDNGGGYMDLADNGRSDSVEISDESEVGKAIRRFYGGGAASKSMVQQFRQDYGKQGPRGYLTINPSSFTVTLTKNANLSTFIHESGHLYLELMKKAAAGEGAPADILADWEIIKEYLGSDGDLTREQHETFARSFEAYLMEGKAPSQELRGIFNRFKSWMISVYKQLRNLDVELTDEIRGVFDRLLASEEATKVAAQDVISAFQTEDAVSSPASFRNLAELRLQAIAEAEDEMIAQAQAEIRRTRSKAYRERKEALTEEITAEVDAQPVYAVQRLLKTGNDESMDLPGNYLGRRLSTKALKDLFGDNSATQKLVGMTAAKNGIHPDMLADVYGFNSGYQMVQEIIAAPARSKLIKERVQTTLDTEFGNMATDTDTIERAAVAVHNDKMSRLLVEEAREMARLLGAKDKPTLNESTKIAARAHIKAQPVRNLRPHTHYQAEVKAAREAAEFVAKGNVQKALAAKRRQLLNHHLYREARHAVDRSEVIRKRLKRYESPKAMAKIRRGDPKAANAIDALLAGVEFKRTALSKIDARNALLKYVQEAMENGDPVQVDPALYAGAEMTNWREMTMAQLEELDSSVQALAKQGREADKVRVEGELVDRAELVVELGSIAGNNMTRKIIERYAVDHRSPITKLFTSYLASLRKIEFECRFADGDIVGKWHRTIFQPFVDAQNAKEAMLSDSVSTLQEIMGGIDRDHARYLGAEITFLGTKMQRADLYVVALNMGNQGNWDRLFSRRWKGQEEAVLREIQEQLSLEDFRRIEALGQMIDTFYEPMAEVSERVDGIRPPKVEPRPLVLDKYGVTLSGWYYPVKYQDTVGTREQAVLEEANAIDMGPSPITGQVSKSMTKERMAGAGGVISLDMSGLPQHLHQVVHYVTHYEAVRNFDKLRKSSEFRAMYESFFDQDGYKQLRSWLQNIAANGTLAETSHDASKTMDAIFRRARYGGSLIGLGWKVSSAAMQLLGVGPAAKEVGGVRMSRWMLKLAYGRVGTVGQAKVHPDFQKALDASPELRHLDKQIDRDVREFTDRTIEVMKRNPVIAQSQWLMDQAYYMLIAVQKHVNAATWLASYEQAQEQGRTVQESEQYADATVRQTQSGGGLKDLAGLQAGNELTKLVTLFYSYFAVQHNQLRLTGRKDLLRGFWQGQGPNGRAKSLQKFAAANFFIVIAPSLVEALLRGDDEDKEEMAPYLANKVAGTYMAGLPIFRDIYSAASMSFNGPSTPLDQVVQSLVKGSESAIDVLTLDGEWNDVRNIAKAGTLVTWLPFYQVYSYVEALAASDEFSGKARNVLFGTPYSERRELNK